MSSSIEIQDLPLWNKMKSKGIPLSFDIEITARCNMNCAHCCINLPAGDASARAAELTASEIQNIARQAVEMGAVWCLVTGGEPLLRADFEDVYLTLKRLGLLVSVFTNATLINEKHIALFKKYPPRDIEITVYGVTRETYEAVTRKAGSFERFMAGLDLLLTERIPVRLKTMAIQSNLHEHRKIADFCRARTKDYFRFDPQLHLRFDGNPERNQEIRDQRLSPAQIVALENNDEKRISTMRDKCDKLINDQFTSYNCDHLFHCGAGKGSFCVSYDGRFRLCSSLWAEGTTCDLRRYSLIHAWEYVVPRVRDMRSHRREFLATCRKCELVNLCLWCPAHAHLETGILDGSTPYFCEVAHLRAENLRNNMHREKIGQDRPGSERVHS